MLTRPRNEIRYEDSEPELAEGSDEGEEEEEEPEGASESDEDEEEEEEPAAKDEGMFSLDSFYCPLAPVSNVSMSDTR